MSLGSMIFGGPKKKSPEEMQKIARGQSVLGNLVGSSPYMEEWRRKNKSLYEDYEKRDRSMHKRWKYEDIEINRNLEKERQRYYRKYKDPKEAEKWYMQYETKKRREIERDRYNETKDLKEEKNEQKRDIAKNIKQWK